MYSCQRDSTSPQPWPSHGRVDSTPTSPAANTVTVAAVAGLVGVLSTLPWDGQGCGDVLSRWHEYIAFLLAVQAVFTGLATLVWLLVSSTPDAVPQVASESPADGQD